MHSTDQRDFPARMAMLAETAAFVQGFCERSGIRREDALRLVLIVEELFINTVTHGFNGGSDALIGISLSRDDEHVELRYEDRAPPHDPTARFTKSPESLNAPLETRPIGGLGVYLVGQLSASARYVYEEGMNRLWLTVACRS